MIRKSNISSRVSAGGVRNIVRKIVLKCWYLYLPCKLLPLHYLESKMLHCSHILLCLLYIYIYRHTLYMRCICIHIYIRQSYYTAGHFFRHWQLFRTLEITTSAFSSLINLCSMLRLKYIALSKWIWSACFFLKKMFSLKKTSVSIKKLKRTTDMRNLTLKKYMLNTCVKTNRCNKNICVWYYKKGLKELRWQRTSVSLICWEPKKKWEYKSAYKVFFKNKMQDRFFT